MVRICFILVNTCVLWWHKPESRTVCSSTVNTVSCTYVNLPDRFKSLEGRSLLSPEEECKALKSFIDDEAQEG
jgi:hypothetical protein